MNGKGWGCCIGCVVLGAVGGILYMKHREKMKPMAAQLLAKSMHLKDKALEYAERAKECAGDIAAEAVHINESAYINESATGAQS